MSVKPLEQESRDAEEERQRVFAVAQNHCPKCGAPAPKRIRPGGPPPEPFLCSCRGDRFACRNHGMPGLAVSGTVSVHSTEGKKKWKIISSSTNPSMAE